MAGSFGGFSIREYASKKRAENVAKSWPFGGDADEKQMESVLPPITVTKFRWWRDELESARSSAADAAAQPEDGGDGAAAAADKMSEDPPSGCPACDSLVAPSSSAAAAAAHAVNCPASEETKRRSRPKPKAPKKRSIMEIFAMAPEIKAPANKVSSSKAAEASGGRTSSPTGRKKSKKNKSKRKNDLLDRIHRLRLDDTKFKKTKKEKEKKKKKKMKMNHQSTSTAVEENTRMLKRKTASKGTRNSDGSPDGMHTGTVSDRSACGKKPQRQSSCSLTKHEAIMPPKFSKKKDKPATTARGILKKQGKLVNDSHSQAAVHLEKHVKFVDNAEVQGSSKNSQVAVQQPDGHAESSDKLIGNDEELSIVEVTKGDDKDPVCIESGNGAEVTAEKEHSIDTQEQGNAEKHPSPQRASPLHCRNNLPTESNSSIQVPKSSQDFHTSMKGKSAVIDHSATMENSRCLTSSRGTQVGHTDIQTPGSPLRYNTGSPSRAVCGTSMIRSPRMFSQQRPPRLFLNENLNGFLQPRFATEDTSARRMFYQEVRSQRPMSLISGGFTVGDQWNPRPCSLTDECVYQDLCGLPLNSRGELIQMNSASSSNFVLKQLHSSGMASGPFGGQNPIRPIYAENDLALSEGNFGGRSCPRDLDLFPMHNSDSPGSRPDASRRNPERHVSPSRLPNTDLNLVNVSSDMSRRQGYDSVQHQKGSGKAIPPSEKQNQAIANAAPLTMRLMGKDVAVVESDTREPADENVWTDKEIIIEHQHRGEPLTQSTLQNSKGSANLLLEPQSNRKCESVVKAPESLLVNPYINGRPDSVPQRNRLPLPRSTNPEQQLHSHASSNFTDLREPLVMETRLALPSYHHGSSHSIHWIPEENYRPYPPHPRASGFGFPFLHRDCVGCMQQDSLFQGPFMDLPPWVHSSDRGRSTPIAYSVSFPDEFHRNYRCRAPPNRFNSSMTFTTYGPADPRLPLRSPFGPLHAVHPQLLEAVPGIEPASAENIPYRSRMNPNDTMTSPAFGVRTLDLCAGTKKRPAVKPVDTPRKLDKMANLGPPRHWSTGFSSSKDALSDDEEEFTGGSGDDQRNFTGTERYNTNETGRPGPTKLSAGAKHILKPTQTDDQDVTNSRPIHSVVPIGGDANHNMTVPEPETRVTRIYKI